MIIPQHHIMAFILMMVTTNLIIGKVNLIQYQKPVASSTMDTSFNIIHLNYISTFEIMPLLRSLCDSCNWYINHSRQHIGLSTNESKWATYKKAIRDIDKKRPLLQLNVDVIEVSNIQNESYKHIFNQLSEPVELNAFDSIALSIGYMISSGNASVISSPRIMSISGKESSITVGDNIPYTTVTHANGITSESIDYIQSGITLKITPHLHKNQMIELTIILDYKTINGYQDDGIISIPIVSNRRTEMNIQVKSNTTIIFAGLLDQSSYQVINSVPILGSIPWIGELFKSKKTNTQTNDLLFKVTPTLIHQE